MNSDFALITVSFQVGDETGPWRFVDCADVADGCSRRLQL